MTPEYGTQGPKELELVRPIKYVLMCAIEVVELEF